MKYISIDELNYFNFHDSELKKIDIDGDSMRWKLSSVNATTQNSQNSFNEDMCIKEAEVLFENYNIEEIVFSAYEVHDSDNNLIESAEAITANPNQYDEILKKTLDSYCYIYSMDELSRLDNNKNMVCFNIDGGAGDYYITLSFSKSIVQWDEYNGKAWYEDEKWKKN